METVRESMAAGEFATSVAAGTMKRSIRARRKRDEHRPDMSRAMLS